MSLGSVLLPAVQADRGLLDQVLPMARLSSATSVKSTSGPVAMLLRRLLRGLPMTDDGTHAD